MLAGDLRNGSRAFHAHEVLESAWKADPEPEREPWRGLALLAVGLTHILRRSAVERCICYAAPRTASKGTQTTRRMVSTRLGSWSGARALAVGVEMDGLGGLTPGISSHTFDLMLDAGTIDVPRSKVVVDSGIP